MNKIETLALIKQNSTVCKNEIANPVVGEMVYVTDFKNGFNLVLESAVVKKIREDSFERNIGVEFKNNVGFGHNLDGMAQDQRGYWIDVYDGGMILSTRNMEKFYTALRIKG